MTSIYLAGKISKGDWRHDVVPLRAAWGRDNSGEMPTVGWPVLPKSVLGTFDYVGPHFISDDHGCAHGRDRHGCGAGDYVCGAYPGPTRERMRDLCLSAIYRADIFFAWLDDPSAYGTLVELGFATALRKRVVIGVPREGVEALEDMWFAQTCGLRIVADSPQEALKELVNRG